ncbi:MAG: putative membrane protein [Methylococcaceae bacterium NSP1-2]|nr:MAG: putative membrane protein [Methylococcaceae bacterium NSP1-2]
MMNKIGVGVFFLVLVWSAINPKDYLTWIMEIAPAIIAFIVLLVTQKRFPLTNLLYRLILIHCIILMIGGHYTYAEVPLFDWLKNNGHFDRNNYDKIGHFAQGFVPAIVAREIIIRHAVLNNQGWLNFFVISVCLAISAFYELIEWWGALLIGQEAEAFLGTQGYIWDTQSDMAYALLGVVLALVTLSQLHNRAIERLHHL